MSRRHTPSWLRILGPGLVTGAADDDPSGIATYSQAGAAFGYTQLWTLLLCLPLMISVQEATARIGAVTGHGLARVTKDYLSRRVLLAIVGLVVVANVINIGADIAAVGAVLGLLVTVSVTTLTLAFTFALIALMTLVRYHRYVRVLKILALALLSYVVTALIVAEPWSRVLTSTVIPHLQWTSAYWYVIVGILGTTISPYMFFWQASEEVEELNYADAVGKERRTLRVIRMDNATGMVISQIGSWFMMLTTATVLHAHGVTTINTAADAAKALEPLVHSFPHAGELAKIIFAVGVLGMGILGIPVLAGSASYAVSEYAGWNEGYDQRVRDARGFYGVIVAATMLGLVMTMTGVSPIKALIFAAVVNGMVAVPLVWLIRHLSSRADVMGDGASGPWSKRLLLTTFVVMGLCALVLVGSLLHG
jgi:NRAMP (natural resistance-associated macrophage protein)-like metal ion transporter